MVPRCLHQPVLDVGLGSLMGGAGANLGSEHEAMHGEVLIEPEV